MKLFTVTALGIAFKIWIIAVLMNTIADTLLLDRLSGDAVAVFFLIALFSSLFSVPIFLVLWVMVYSLLKGGRNASYILKWLLVAGIGMAIAAWAFFTGSFRFMDSETMGLVIAAPLSGVIAIYAGYANIKKACVVRDEEKNLQQGFDMAQPTTNGSIPDIVG